jgi:hypothetical protein
MKDECGVTRISLDNGKELSFSKGRPIEIQVDADLGLGECNVTAHFRDSSEHVFTGFSCGYGGEGPRGLHTYLKNSGVDIPWEVIVNPKRVGNKVKITAHPHLGTYGFIFGSK